MTTTLRPNWTRVLQQALAGGIAGAVIVDLYLWFTVLLPSHGTLLAKWQSEAQAALGPAASTHPVYAWIGLVVHFVVSIGWAGGYAYFAQTQTFVNARWLVSGLVYGGVVYVMTELLLLGAHMFVFPPTPLDFLNQVVASTVFFGVPVAYTVARMSRA